MNSRLPELFERWLQNQYSPADMEELNRKVVRGWEANCDAEEVMEPAPDAAPAGTLLIERDLVGPVQGDAGAPAAAAVAPPRSKFDDQEDD